MIKKITFLCLFLVFNIGMAFSQSRKITGTVKDESGLLLPGATVSVTGSNAATLTNADGKFTIDVPARAITLHVTYVGYQPTDQVVSGTQNEVIITLQSKGTTLSDIVVIGYGTSSKRNLLGPVGTVTGSQITDRKTTQVSQALQGAIPGVTVSRNSASPGSGATIRIRGITSLGNNDALIIIDGAPGSLDNVNPDDIETVSVLKDAASASIYGSRAAAGVILITTKRGKNGQASLNYSSDFGLQYISATPPVVDAARYVALYTELQVNDGLTPTYPADVVSNYESYNRQDPIKYANADWNKLFYRSPAFQQRHNLGITVGNEMIRSRVNVGYIDQKGVEPNRTFNRLTIRANTDMTINKKLTANVDVAYNRSNPKGPNYDVINTLRQINPTYPAYYADGRYAAGKDGLNPIALNQLGGFADSVQHVLTAKLQLAYSPFKNFKITGIFAPNLSFSSYRNFSKIVYTYSPTDPTVIINTYGTTNSLTQRQIYNQQLNAQVLANYTMDFGVGHHLSALLGYEANNFHYEINGEYRDGFTLPDYNVLSAGSVTNASNGGNINESALSSFFSRIDYNYRNKYYLQGILRNDASSRFAPGHRHGLFPAVSAGWVISEENFMQGSPFSFLKLRADYGVVGNQNIGNYPYQSLINFGTALFYNNGNITSYPTGYQSNLAVQNISWEKTATSDIGLDVGFLKNRLNINADAYYKNTTGILLTLPVASFIGLGPANQNAGAMKNYGWEAEVSWKDRIGSDFSYNISANVANNGNKVTDLKGINTLGNKAIIEGQEYNVWYGYQAAGYFKDAADVSGSAKINGKEKPGDIKYRDINGDGKITADGDRVPLGSSLPHYTYGGSINLKYKAFDMGIYIQGVAKRSEMLSGTVVQPFQGNFGNVPVYVADDHWTPSTPDAKYPRLSFANSANNYVASSKWLINAGYFRLKNITVGYTLPAKLISRIGVKSARIYIAGSDLFYLSRVPKGWDPENLLDYPSSQTAYPITRTFLGGLSVQF